MLPMLQLARDLPILLVKIATAAAVVPRLLLRLLLPLLHLLSDVTRVDVPVHGLVPLLPPAVRDGRAPHELAVVAWWTSEASVELGWVNFIQGLGIGYRRNLTARPVRPLHSRNYGIGLVLCESSSSSSSSSTRVRLGTSEA